MKKTLVLSLFITFSAFANSPSHESSPACDSKQTTDCSSDAHSTDGHGSGHNDLSARMNSLFPQPEKNPAVSNRPLPVKLSSPSFLSSVSAGSVKLEWAPSEGASAYHVQVATDPQFKWLVINETAVKGNNYDFTKAEAGKQYFWRVAATKYENVSMFTKSLFTSSAFEVK